MQLEDIKSIGILGAGVMGGGIAQCAIQAGFKTIVRDLTDEICENAKDIILNSRFGFNKAVEMGKMSQEELDAAMGLLSLTTDVNDLKDCDLIIEAIGGGIDGAIENKPLKLDVWGEMDRVVKKEAVFASNTIARKTRCRTWMARVEPESPAPNSATIIVSDAPRRTGPHKNQR